MQPNWCGKCRINSELNQRPLKWRGLRHYCWGCGIVRSQGFHADNPLKEGEESTPNYCRPCRTRSPSYDCKLREVSELGSEVNIRDQAFQRQLQEAELSEVDENEVKAVKTLSSSTKNTVKRKLYKKAMNTEVFTVEDDNASAETSSDSSSKSSTSSPEPCQKTHPKKRNARDSGEVDSRRPHSSHGPPPTAHASKSRSDMAVTIQDEMEELPNNSSRAKDDHHHPDTGDVKGGHNACLPLSDHSSSERSSQSAFSGASKKQVHWSNEEQQKDDGQRSDHREENQHPSTINSGLPSFSGSYLVRERQPEQTKQPSALRARRLRDPARMSTGSPNWQDSASMDENSPSGKDKAVGTDGGPFQSFDTVKHNTGKIESSDDEDTYGGTTSSPVEDKVTENESATSFSEIPSSIPATAYNPFNMHSAAGHQGSSESYSGQGYWNSYAQMPAYRPYGAPPYGAGYAASYGSGYADYNNHSYGAPGERYPGSSYPYDYNHQTSAAHASYHQYGHQDYYSGYNNSNSGINNQHDAAVPEYNGAPPTNSCDFDCSIFAQPNEAKFVRLSELEVKEPEVSWEMYEDGDGDEHADAEPDKSDAF
ncbi:hypothetical protein BD289DRAFT_456063 [Coniella lustricola]|uniref:Uncharacterized protein n=1 Tax=Coniella lustricola TaxID=2025994 RepID=A0A2T2ZX82_9PEZI|nr:hypothetical protein BD289DRAFT_456063 [Coniella lustricola]